MEKIHIALASPYVPRYTFRSRLHIYRRYTFLDAHCARVSTVGEKEVLLQKIRSGFEFVPGLFGILLRGECLYGAWPRTVLILIEFKFIVPEL